MEVTVIKLPRTWEEQDAMTEWRKVLCYVQRPGVRSKIKRGYRRRVRHYVKAQLHKDYDTV